MFETTKQLFLIEICDNGSYLAVRKESPMFCFCGSSIKEVIEKAELALNFFKAKAHERPS